MLLVKNDKTEIESKTKRGGGGDSHMKEEKKQGCLLSDSGVNYGFWSYSVKDSMPTF